MPLPFDLLPVSRGYAELDPGACRAGAAAAAGAARSLSALLGVEVSIAGAPLPAPGAPDGVRPRVAIELGAIGLPAEVELDAPLVARIVDGLAGGTGASVAAGALTPVEASALELLALVALDGACAVDAVAALAPRLARAAAPAGPDLAVELRISAGGARGRARAFIPAAAVAALRGPGAGDLPGIAVPVSLRSGSGALAPDELDALAPGDVVVLDEAPGTRHALVLPGGAAVRGRLDEEGFHPEETSMADPLPQLPVALEVELARFPVTLADLARLAPGAVLPVPIDRRGLVTLRAGERAVARGQLVDVDGAIGVRIDAVELAP